VKFVKSEIPDVVAIEPQVFPDARGYFFESYNQKKFTNGVGGNFEFVQDNESYSSCGVLRGLHYQIKNPQGKLVRVTEGEVFDVAVDLRKSSSSFGAWVGCILSAENNKQLWIPPGFAHGFLVLSKNVKFLYKVTDYRYPEHERCLKFDDPAVNIQWPKISIEEQFSDFIVSDKDAGGSLLCNAETYE